MQFDALCLMVVKHSVKKLGCKVDQKSEEKQSSGANFSNLKKNLLSQSRFLQPSTTHTLGQAVIKNSGLDQSRNKPAFNPKILSCTRPAPRTILWCSFSYIKVKYPIWFYGTAHVKIYLTTVQEYCLLFNLKDLCVIQYLPRQFKTRSAALEHGHKLYSLDTHRNIKIYKVDETVKIISII